MHIMYHKYDWDIFFIINVKIIFLICNSVYIKRFYINNQNKMYEYELKIFEVTWFYNKIK